jgi:hypothetical protein
MALFGIGNILLKIKRRKLPRPERSSWPALLLAITAVLLAIVGNAVLNPAYLAVFFEYFMPAILLVAIMLNRTMILKLIFQVIKYLLTPIQSFLIKSNDHILKLIDQINSQEFVYFTKDDDVATLNKVMLYIKNNEHTKRLKIVSVFENGEAAPQRLLDDLDVLDREYPSIDIEYVQLKGTFGPALIKKLSHEWRIPVNFMFIASPGDHFPYRVEQLGGVRLII